MSARDRQARYRKRLRRGLASYRTDVGEDVFAAMDYLGWTNEGSAERRDEMAELLSRALSDWARTVCPFL